MGNNFSKETLVQGLINDIQEARSEREVLTVLAQSLTNLLGAAGTAILMVDAGKKRLEGRLGEPAAKWPNFPKVTISLDEPAVVSLAVKGKASIAVPDTREYPRIKQWVAAYYRCVAVLVVPIMAVDEAIGCALVKEEKYPRHFTDREIKNAERLAAAAGRAIKRLEGQGSF